MSGIERGLENKYLRRKKPAGEQASRRQRISRREETEGQEAKGTAAWRKRGRVARERKEIII